VTDLPASGEAAETTTRVQVAARGSTHVTVEVGVPSPSKRRATVKLTAPATGRVISGRRGVAYTDNLAFMALFAGRQNYTTDVPDIYSQMELGERVSEPETYGAAANPTGSPVGGGEGYQQIVTAGDVSVSNREDLLPALKAAEAGEVVYVAPQARIDLSGLAAIPVPAGVTLAGNRGYDGAEGPLLFTNRIPKERSQILFSLAGEGSRVTGLRIRGPDPEYAEQRARPALHRGVSVGPGGEVDNCEISHFYREGVGVRGPNVHIHHNFIHDVGAYPVVVGVPDALIEANVIQWGWHAIAGSGRIPSNYEARYNIFKPHKIAVADLSHCLDMHPARAGLYASPVKYIAGDYVTYHHNTLMLGTATGVRVRGTSRRLSRVYRNWFLTEDVAQALGPHARGGETPAANFWAYDNAYGSEKRLAARLVWHTKPYILFKSPPPPRVEHHKVSGSLDVDVEVEVYEGLSLKAVRVELDGQQIYLQRQPPSAGALIIDTTELTNGVHVLRVTAMDNRNVLGSHEVVLEVAN
jgi:hypothetical protein